MNAELKELIKEDLKRHEGVMYEVYLDTEGLPTAGIGHLLDAMTAYEVGDTVTKEQVDEWFTTDFAEAVSDCCAIFLNFESLPDQVKRVLVNMAFNLGRSRLGKFKNMVTAVNEGNYPKAADEMVDSKWYRQVKTRGVELVDLMRTA